jgi:predicted aspartyl protease
MKMKRKIQAEDVLILIDSGGSHTFVSEKVASKLVGIQALSVPVTVQVANGGQLNCTSYIPSASWSVSGYQFRTDMRVIPLQQYDLIVSMDWL